MGSDRHYPEEAPPHLVNVDGFWIDRTPVTNREFRKFVNATGYITFAEIAPDPKGDPGALPHVLKPGSLAFTRSPRSISATGASGGISSSVPAAPRARAGQTVPAGYALARAEIRAARQILGPGQLADLAAWELERVHGAHQSFERIACNRFFAFVRPICENLAKHYG